jgi:microcystin-dependent protein
MDPYLGEIRMFGGNFAPLGWAFCNGQILPISGNDALYSLLGTMYGGDGQTTFGLPNLAGRIPMHFGTSSGVTYPQGQIGGTETVTLTAAQLPTHTHTLIASTAAGVTDQPANMVLAMPTGSGIYLYYEGSPGTPMSTQAVGITGNSMPHDNTQPFLCVSFIIALEGIYPPQS